MLQGSSWGNQFEYWDYFNNPDTDYNHRVMFDGPTKTIWIIEGVTEIYIRDHFYSDWKEWCRLYDNTKYERAFETEGGRPISDTERLGDSYLIVNGWKIRQRDGSTPVTITGNMFGYNEAGEPEYPYLADGDGLISVNTTVSNLVGVASAVEVEVPPKGLTDEQDITLRLAYEEARRSRAMQTNRVDINRVGAGASSIDTVQVFDDDGVTLLYTIVVTGDECDNRQVTYIKNYPPGYPEIPLP